MHRTDRRPAGFRYPVMSVLAVSGPARIEPGNPNTDSGSRTRSAVERQYGQPCRSDHPAYQELRHTSASTVRWTHVGVPIGSDPTSGRITTNDYAPIRTTRYEHMNDQIEIQQAIERSHARRAQAENQLRSLRGAPLGAPLAELDSLLAYELGLESRLAQVLTRTTVGS